jgi:hypothetical protein
MDGWMVQAAFDFCVSLSLSLSGSSFWIFVAPERTKKRDEKQTDKQKTK